MKARPAASRPKVSAAKAKPKPGPPAGRDPDPAEAWPAGRPLPQVIGVAVALAALGAALGLFSAFAHSQRIGAVTIGVPITIAAQGGLVVASGVLGRSRLAAGLPALGWMISVLIFAQPKGEGDLVIAADAPGLAYLIAGLVVLGALSSLPFHRVGTAGRGSEQARPAGRG